MDMYDQLGVFRDSYVSDTRSEDSKALTKLKCLSKKQIMKKVLHLTRTKKNLLLELGS